MEKMMDRCGLFGMFDNNGFHTSPFNIITDCFPCSIAAWRQQVSV